MLSGIKTGKKKKKAKTAATSSEPSANELISSLSVATANSSVATPPPSSNETITQDNLFVAERLRQSLASGGRSALPGSSKDSATPVNAYAQQASVLDRLQQRGRIESTTVQGKKDTDESIIVALPMGKASANSAAAAAAAGKKEDDMTVQELVAQERREANLGGMSWDEQMTRNMVRAGKHKKRKLTAHYGEDSDDEVERLQQLLPGAETASKKEGTRKHERASEKSQQRDRHRLMHNAIKEEKITSKCSWWLESSSFRKHRLLALGNHVSLVMAPPNSSLIPGQHFYLVPLKHAPSMVQIMADDPQVWPEVQRFHNSLQNLYARQGKSVILLETVLSHSKGLWQTKVEVVPVAFGTLQDAPMYFLSAMREKTEEWGTHNKLLKVMNPQKPLSSVVPKGFPYFCVEWGKIATSPTATGYAQIIESDAMRHDFGLDTVAAMLELDPIRMQRQQTYSYEEERHHIAEFLKQWDKVDWTKELDTSASKFT